MHQCMGGSAGLAGEASPPCNTPPPTCLASHRPQSQAPQLCSHHTRLPQSTSEHSPPPSPEQVRALPAAACPRPRGLCREGGGLQPHWGHRGGHTGESDRAPNSSWPRPCRSLWLQTAPTTPASSMAHARRPPTAAAAVAAVLLAALAAPAAARGLGSSSSSLDPSDPLLEGLELNLEGVAHVKRHLLQLAPPTVKYAPCNAASELTCGPSTKAASGARACWLRRMLPGAAGAAASGTGLDPASAGARQRPATSCRGCAS